MMGWQHPAAFWGMALLAIPFVIHLLRMHRAARVLFPSVRFVGSSHTAAVRFMIPSDWLLLALRMGIVALGVCAAAGPLLLTGSRVATWNAQVARAVVVDTSASMSVAGTDGPAPRAAADEAARSERQSADYSRQIDVGDLTVGTSRAAVWLASAPPARREIVVISDFQRGAFDAALIRQVPANIGIRLVQVGRAVQSAHLAGVDLFGAEGIPRRALSIDLTPDGTAATMSQRAGPDAGLRVIVSASSRVEVEALLKSVAVAGTPAASPQQPMAIQLDDSASSGTPAPIQTGWMLETVLRLREDTALARLAASSPARALTRPGPWTEVLRNREGKLVMRAASIGRELLIEIAAPPDSLVAAGAVRAALVARQGGVEQPEEEIARMSSAQLSAWNRQPGAVDAGIWRNATSNDARWFWAAVLVLLAVEQWVRSRSVSKADKELTRAAA
jgi:Aerotolerance regulator N-terminal